MKLFTKEYEVKRNEMGFLFKRNVLAQKLEPGYYNVFDFWNKTELITLSTVPRLITVINQEVMTADNVALRFSFNVMYNIANGEVFLKMFNVENYVGTYYRIAEADNIISNMAQMEIRNRIAALTSEELNEKRNEIYEFNSEKLKNQAAIFGIGILEAQLKDITFPKMIQDLFAKQLEAKIRAKTDLENARTAVASARTLKNAADLMKENQYIKFIKYMETISRIAEKGKATFVIGDVPKAV